jgi:GxxExxY protein
MELDQVTHTIIGASILVHRTIGVGLLESAYEECLAYELSSRGLYIERQKAIPLVYKGVVLECSFRPDLIVENQVVVELKCCARLDSSHEAQMLTYLRITGLTVGLILNFHAPVLKDGIKRLVNGFSAPSPRLGVSAVKPQQSQ